MEVQDGLNLTISATALISIPLTIWIVVTLVRINRRVQRIDRFLMTRAHQERVDYIPDQETLQEAKRIAALREQRQSELREMEKS